MMLRTFVWFEKGGGRTGVRGRKFVLGSPNIFRGGLEGGLLSGRPYIAVTGGMLRNLILIFCWWLVFCFWLGYDLSSWFLW
jgi:hypothetical protein